MPLHTVIRSDARAAETNTLPFAGAVRTDRDRIIYKASKGTVLESFIGQDFREVKPILEKAGFRVKLLRERRDA